METSLSDQPDTPTLWQRLFPATPTAAHRFRLATALYVYAAVALYIDGFLTLSFALASSGASALAQLLEGILVLAVLTGIVGSFALSAYHLVKGIRQTPFPQNLLPLSMFLLLYVLPIIAGIGIWLHYMHTSQEANARSQHAGQVNGKSSLTVSIDDDFLCQLAVPTDLKQPVCKDGKVTDNVIVTAGAFTSSPDSPYASPEATDAFRFSSEAQPPMLTLAQLNPGKYWLTVVTYGNTCPHGLDTEAQSEGPSLPGNISNLPIATENRCLVSIAQSDVVPVTLGEFDNQTRQIALRSTTMEQAPDKAYVLFEPR